MRGILQRLGELVYSPHYVSRRVSEFPNEVADGTVFIVREGNQAETLIFKCPCGCDQIVYLNLLNDTKPCWDFKHNMLGLITVMPSIARSVGCKSHFYIIKGRVVKCKY
jgi:hypothetical protein